MRLAHAKLKIATLIAFGLLNAFIFIYLFQDAGGRLPFSSRYTVSALMPDTQNLVPDSDVDAAGIKVGSVDSVKPAGNNALVTFSIETKTPSFPPLYRNATTQVRTKTLVGESYLEITPGTPAAGKLPAGATLPPTSAATSVTLPQILDMFDAKTRASVRADMKGLGIGLNGHGAQLNQFFGSINPVVQNGNAAFSVLNPERDQLAALLRDTGVVLGALGQRTADYQTLIVDAKSTAQAVASRAAELRGALETLPSTLAQARHTVSALSGFSTRATPVFANLRTASSNLSPAIAELEPAAASGRVLFRRLHPFLTAIQPLFGQLRPAAAKLTSVVGPLDAVLRQANPALDYLKNYATEFGSFFANVGGITNSADGLSDRGRVDAVIDPGLGEVGNLNATERQFLNALLKAGGAQGTLLNSYPEPGTAGTPNAQSNYARVQPGQ